MLHLTRIDFETFQRCPARWDMRNVASILPDANEYTDAIRNTVISMYSWQMANNRHMHLAGLRERWDQAWWAANQVQNPNSPELLSSAAEGWIMLEKLWANFYRSAEYGSPVAVSFPYSYHANDIEITSIYDVILVNKDNIVTQLSIGGFKSEWMISVSAGTKVDLCCLTTAIGHKPDRLIHLDIESKKTDYTERTLYFDDAYLSRAQSQISMMATLMYNGNNIYCVPSNHCLTCPVRGKCYY